MGCVNGNQSDTNNEAKVVTVIDNQVHARRQSLMDEVFKHIGPPTLPAKQTLTECRQQLVVRVIQGINLPSSNSSFLVIAKACGKKYQTSSRRSKNPVWNDNFILSDTNLLSKAKDIMFDLYEGTFACHALQSQIDNNKLCNMSVNNFSFCLCLETQWTSNTHIGHFAIHFAKNLNECETPAVWYPIADKQGNRLGNAEIQVQIQANERIDVVEARNYTNILQFTVKTAHLQNSDWSNFNSKKMGDPYVTVEIGKHIFKTKSVKKSQNPIWNESFYLFMDMERQMNNKLTISIMENDFNDSINYNDSISTGYLPVYQIGSGSGMQEFNATLSMTGDAVITSLNMDEKNGGDDDEKDEKKDNQFTTVDVSAKLIPRRDIERNFYHYLLHSFDHNTDGKLDEMEIRLMLLYLDVSESFTDFMLKFDEDQDGYLSQDEAIKMLTDVSFQESNDSGKVCVFFNLCSN